MGKVLRLGRDLSRGEVAALVLQRAPSDDAGRVAARVAANDQRYRDLARLEDDVITLGLAIARKLVALEVSTRPEQILEIFAERLGALSGARGFVLVAHPEDLEIVRTRRGELLERLGSSAALHLEPDESVERGGCVVVTEDGRVDARIEEQLDAIERALRIGDG